MPWKTAEDVRRITFTALPTGKLLRLRAGSYSEEILVGRLVFGHHLEEQKHRPSAKQGTRVAIKRFEPEKMPDAAKAMKYQRRIDDLRAAGVNIPKMGMFLLKAGTKIGEEKLEKDEWVQITWLLGSIEEAPRHPDAKVTHRSKLEGFRSIKIPAARAFFVRELAKMASADYHTPIDAFGVLEETQEIFVFDLDNIVKRPLMKQALADGVVSCINRLVRETMPPGERDELDRLFHIALKKASPELRPFLTNARKDLHRT